MTLAETYQQSIDMFAGNNSKIIGLTATPGRHGLNDDEIETDKLVKYYENNIVNMDTFCDPDTPIMFLQNEKILSTIKRLKLVTSTNIELSDNDKSRIANNLSISEKSLSKIGEDSKRNLLIVDQIEKAIQIQNIKKILVFASSKDNSGLLAALL
ncbi:MAG TPA: hypothetical protein DHV86_02845, partial [Methylophilaceae bacterium]|nr:hypothetical protein [Methylophilaceae bacterium]